jgi:hypothetical protein
VRKSFCRKTGGANVDMQAEKTKTKQKIKNKNKINGKFGQEMRLPVNFFSFVFLELFPVTTLKRMSDLKIVTQRADIRK